MQPPLSRRDFIGTAATASLGLALPAAGAADTTRPPASVTPSAQNAVQWPITDGLEEAALLDVLRSGKWGRTSGGTRVREFEALFAKRMAAKHCIATSSGTSALLTALGALNVGPGDEVILPPYTFVATFNAITASYALPVFVDSDPATFQIDATKIEAAITPATRLLLPVHIGGSTCEIENIAAIAKRRAVTLLEDACQAPLAEWRGRPIGTHGIGGCFSFQASKNLTAGEGGAVLTNDDKFADLCHDFHTPGGAKKSVSSGRGSNFRLTEFQAALLIAQYSRLEAQMRTRDANAAHLTSLLEKIPGIAPAKLAGGNTRSAWHLYMLRYDASKFSGLSRAKFLAALAKAGVAASGGYSSLNHSPHVRAIATNPHYRRIYGEAVMNRWLERNACPSNDRLVEEAVWFGQTKLLAPRTEMERIAETIADVQRRSGELARS